MSRSGDDSRAEVAGNRSEKPTLVHYVKDKSESVYIRCGTTNVVYF